jgi:predicted transcriptional regulator
MVDVLMNQPGENSSDFYDGLPQAIKDSIEQALNEIEQGKVYSHEEVIDAIKSKYNISNL